MFVLLALWATTGGLLPEDTWSRDKIYMSLQSCTEKRIEFQKKIDAAILEDKGKEGALTVGEIQFICVPTNRKV